LALDVGDKRIGVAVSDPFGFSGTPLDTLQNSERVFNEIEKYIKEYKPVKIVVGLPLTLSGQEGEQAKKTRAFVEKLKQNIKDLPPIVFEDERFTTDIAEERLSMLTKSKKKMKKKLDSVSAVVILESYLSRNPV